MVDITRALRQADKTGKVNCGIRATVRSVKAGEAKMVLTATSLPDARRKEIEAACEAKNIPIVPYKGNSLELGPALGKAFAVSVAAILDPGESDVMALVRS